MGTTGDAIGLGEVARALWRRRSVIVASCGLFMAAAGIFLGLAQPTWRATALVALQLRQPRVIDTMSVTPDLAQSAQALSEKGLIATEIEALRAPALIRRTVAAEQLDHDPEFVKDQTGPLSAEEQAVRAFSKALTISALNRSPVLAVTVEARSPTTAARLANQHASLYRNDQLTSRGAATKDAATFLRQRLEPLKTASLAAERKVADYRRTHGLGQQGDDPLSSRQRDDMNASLAAARIELATADAAWHGAEQARKQGALSSFPNVLLSPVVRDLRALQAENDRTLADLSTRYGERHPRMIEARARHVDLERRLRLEEERIFTSLRATRDSIRAKTGKIKKLLLDLEQRRAAEEIASLELQRLELEADAARSSFQQFLRRLQETQGQTGLERPDSRILSAATPPPKPASPRPVLILAAGAGAGVLLGLALAVILETVETRLTGPDMARQRLPASVGPMFPLRRPQDSPDMQMEAAKAIVASAAMGANGEKRLIAVTSAAPGEGKTTLALSVARAFASFGRRVAILGLDMRRPALADAVPDSDFPIIERLLSDETSFPEICSALSVLRPREANADAAKLLCGDGLGRVLTNARMAVDVVVVDTPPLSPVADARLITPLCDVVLFAVRWRSTDVRVALQGLEDLRFCGAPEPIAILTQVDMKKQGSYGYGGYGGGYNALSAYAAKAS